VTNVGTPETCFARSQPRSRSPATLIAGLSRVTASTPKVPNVATISVPVDSPEPDV
jgi:hypothetical protein